MSRRLAFWGLASALFATSCVLKVVDPLAPKVSGFVGSADGEPVQGVRVEILASGESVLSNADGMFRFKQVPNGDLDVVVHSGSKSAVSLESLKPNMEYALTVKLDEHDEVFSIDVASRSPSNLNSIAELYSAMVRPEGRLAARSRGIIRTEIFVGGDHELQIELEGMEPDDTYDVHLHPRVESPSTNVLLGTAWSDADGSLSFDYQDFSGHAERRFGQLHDRIVSVRRKNDDQVQLKGSDSRPEEGRRKGKSDLRSTGVLPRADGFVMIKTTPPGREDKGDGETFDIKVQHLERRTTYDVCIRCATGGTSMSGRRSSEQESGKVPLPTSRVAKLDTFILGEPRLVLSSPSVFDVPILVDANMDVRAFKFTVEYHSDCFQDPDFSNLVPGPGLVDQNGNPLTSSDLSIRLLVTDAPNDFANSPWADRRVVVTVNVTNGNKWIRAGEGIGVFSIRFTAAPTFGTTPVPCQFAWDDRLVVGGGSEAPPCFLTRNDNRNVLPEEIFFTTPVFPATFECFATITTNGGGNGFLKLDEKKGDVLPCHPTSVADLEGAQIEIRDGSQAVLVGSVPKLDP
jgi:hypothetical protein